VSEYTVATGKDGVARVHRSTCNRQPATAQPMGTVAPQGAKPAGCCKPKGYATADDLSTTVAHYVGPKMHWRALGRPAVEIAKALGHDAAADNAGRAIVITGPHADAVREAVTDTWKEILDDLKAKGGIAKVWSYTDEGYAAARAWMTDQVNLRAATLRKNGGLL